MTTEHMRTRFNRILATHCAAAALATVALAAKFTDSFRSVELNAAWTKLIFLAAGPGGQPVSINILPSLWRLVFIVQGTGTAACALEGYELIDDSWKCSIEAKEAIDPAQVIDANSASGYLGIQWGTFANGVDLATQLNGYQLFSTIFSDSAADGWAVYEGGVETDSDSVARSQTSIFRGKMSATYNARQDRLTVQVGKFRATFNSFNDLSPFAGQGNPFVYVGGESVGFVVGTPFVFDDFVLTGKGVAVAP
jgi:hypothetical protein